MGNKGDKEVVFVVKLVDEVAAVNRDVNRVIFRNRSDN